MPSRNINASTKLLRVVYRTTHVKITPDKATTQSKMSEEVIEPTDHDILMGRGGKNNQHVGNEKLRLFARERCEEYRTSSKKGKSYISRELVRRVRDLSPQGRFLKKSTESGLWEDVGDDVAREKASQALRDAVSQKYDNPTDKSPPKSRPKAISPQRSRSTVGESIPRPQLHRRTSSDPCGTAEHSSESRKAQMQEWRDETVEKPSPVHSAYYNYSTYPTPQHRHSSSSVTPAPTDHYGKRRRYFSDSAVGTYSSSHHYDRAHYDQEHERPILPVTASPIQVPRPYPTEPVPYRTRSDPYAIRSEPNLYGSRSVPYAARSDPYAPRSDPYAPRSEPHHTHRRSCDRPRERYRYPTQHAYPRTRNVQDSSSGALSEQLNELPDFDLFNGELLDENGEPCRPEEDHTRRNSTF